MKRQVRLQENICKTHIRLMTVIQSIKELLKLNLKKATQLKNGSKTWSDTSPKKMQRQQKSI